MSHDGSISQLLVELKQGDQAAAQQLWNRTVQRIAAAARRRLANFQVRGIDEHDIAVDVVATLCQGACDQRFPRLEDRRDLWQILMMLVRQRTIDHRRRRGPDWTESALPAAGQEEGRPAGIDFVAGDDVDPAAVAIAVDELERFLGLLDAERRAIVLWKMDGYNHQEIATRLGVSLRSVERKVQLIRRKLEVELSRGGDR